MTETLTGGTASYLEEIAPVQFDSFGGGAVKFFVPRGQRSELPGIPDEALMTFRERGRNPVGLAGFMVAGHRAIRRFAPDIVHFHGSFAGVLGRLPFLIRGRRPRIVYCAHGWSFCREQSAWKTGVFAAIERRLSTVTDAIVNVSRSEERACLTHGLRKEKSRVILNGVRDRGPGSRPPVETNSGCTRLLFIGRFDRQKGLDILLDQFAKFGVSGLTLDILGGHVVDRDPTPLPWPENVTFHGWVPRGDMARYLERADVVVVPSRWEAFGLVAIEAMMHGAAVLASDRGGLPEVVVDGVTGRLFDLDRPEQMREILTITTREDWAKMGRAGRERYELHFDASRMNAELIAVYRQLWAGQGDEPTV